MFSALRTTNTKIGALILVSLLSSQPAFAQGTEGPVFRPTTPSSPQMPGLYTAVEGGQIVVRQPVQDPVSGQFGFTPRFTGPTIVPNNSSGQQFQPPTLGSGLNGQQSPSASTATSLNLEVDGRNGYLSDIRAGQDRAVLAAVNACSSGTPAACDIALRALVVVTQLLNIDNIPGFTRNNLLTKFREVIAGVRASNGAASTRAINIATIDAMFARYNPDSGQTASASPS